MRFFHALATTAAGVWFGGMILIAIVAATTFGEMRKTGVDHPNAIAGQVMAKNFARFDTIQIVCAAVILLWQIMQLVIRGRTALDWLRLVPIVLASGLLAYSVCVLTPKILSLQSTVAGADAEAAARAVFDDFHRSAVRVSQINLVLLVVILITLAWQRPDARPATGDAGAPPAPAEGAPR
ncbi:MAG: DUF4149 domain-containing protein [Phycisphaerae bacterium]